MASWPWAGDYLPTVKEAWAHMRAEEAKRRKLKEEALVEHSLRRAVRRPSPSKKAGPAPVAKLRRDALKAAFAKMVPELREVCAGRRTSWRHAAWVRRVRRTPTELALSSMHGPLHPDTHGDLLGLLMDYDGATGWPLPDDHARKRPLDYMQGVLLPEATIILVRSADPSLTYEDVDRSLCAV